MNRTAARDVLVITGTGGMGIAIARRIGAGRRIVLADVSELSLSAVAATLRGEGHDVLEVVTDVSDQTSVEALAAAADAAGSIRAVVHTAGVSPVQAGPELIVRVDVMGTAYVLDAFEPYLQPNTAGVVIASMAGTMTALAPEVEHALATTPTAMLGGLAILDPSTLDPNSAYGIAKRANQVRVQAASVTWGRKGARITSISPGIISTPMGQQELGGPSGDIMRHMTSISAVGRLGTPDDIAATVEFLISPAASFISGIDLVVDGGVTAALRFSDPSA